MDHETNIRFINTHSERYCGNDHLNIFIHEQVLALSPLLSIYPCMICNGLDIVLLQQLCKFFSRFTVGGIDYPGLAFILAYKFYNALQCLFFLDLRLNLIIKVRTVKRRNKNFWFAQSEVLHNITLHFWCGSGC